MFLAGVLILASIALAFFFVPAMWLFAYGRPTLRQSMQAWWHRLPWFTPN